MTVRVRFAPSPTGNPHIGNFRTALYNYLFAKHSGGQFLLRIEDTDRERSKKEFEQSIIESMKWMGMEYDEEPYYQSQQIERHKSEVNRLIEEGKAYRCRCTSERIDQLREDQQKAGKNPQYDGLCREANHPDDGSPFCVRLKTPISGSTTIDEPIRGSIVIDNTMMDDLILLRTDGTPVYNLAVVVDDQDMKITHVIRGDDHLNNTARQVLIFQALGYSLPMFIHLPQILGEDKARLSKRHGSTGVIEYREQGYLPEAMMNYLARLGWGHKDKEFFTKSELIELFNIFNCNKSSAVFDPKKLESLNADHIRALSIEELAIRFVQFGRTKGYFTESQFDHIEENNWLLLLIEAVQDRSKTLVEMLQMSEFVLNEPFAYVEEDAKKMLKPVALPGLEELLVFAKNHGNHASIEAWEKAFHDVMEKHEIKMNKLAPAVRIALTGTKVSPPIFNCFILLSQEQVIERLEKAIAYLNEKQ